jgi:predicted nucleotidyltransferase
MSEKRITPTPFPDINAILQELLESVKEVLGIHFVGLYLEGSLANGDFDQASDIDFVVVTDEPVSDKLFQELQAMHERIARIDSAWAMQLEGSYISQSALQRQEPKQALLPNIERGEGEHLKLVTQDEGWIIHRYILRERGITLVGPDPKTLIDPISPNDLRRVMLPELDGWASQLLDHPDEIIKRGYPSSYIILTFCRMLYTLELGEVVSKRSAASWAEGRVNNNWKTLIERAWLERQHYQPLTLNSDEMKQTLSFIRYMLECSRQVKMQD